MCKKKKRRRREDLFEKAKASSEFLFFEVYVVELLNIFNLSLQSS